MMTGHSRIILPNAHERFEHAIRRGVLSVDPSDTNYAGHYMYMYSRPRRDGKPGLEDGFKHRDTRGYIWVGEG